MLDILAASNFDGLLVPRSVLGRFYPWLHLLSPKWALTNSDLIFPEDDFDKFSAAWIPYICHCNAYTEIFPVLEKKYLFALSHQDDIKEDDRFYYESRLASHIVVFFLRGVVSNDSPLLKKALSKKTEKHVFAFLGSCLQQENTPEDVIKNAQKIWDQYFFERVKGRTLAKEQKIAVEGFSEWVESPYVNIDWKLGYLGALIDMGVCPRDTFSLSRGLVDASQTHLGQVLVILKNL